MTTKTFLKKLNQFFDCVNLRYGYQFELKTTDLYFKVLTHEFFLTSTIFQELPPSFYNFMCIDTDGARHIILSFQRGQFK